jgi:hypothetical protein
MPQFIRSGRGSSLLPPLYLSFSLVLERYLSSTFSQDYIHNQHTNHEGSLPLTADMAREGVDVKVADKTLARILETTQLYEFSPAHTKRPLSYFPDELLLIILSHVRLDGTISDLASSSRVCRQW